MAIDKQFVTVLQYLRAAQGQIAQGTFGGGHGDRASRNRCRGPVSGGILQGEHDYGHRQFRCGLRVLFYWAWLLRQLVISTEGVAALHGAEPATKS